ncbi:inner centromere protein [Scaptodrosophila lebanonensis]|uniref:Inner centromere protein n=1 Tax=Drosophila lebanonensis TaxID=7225 RepID=A0A6J2TZE3_DROLE|nr:inner centromere protein [Scaptodrosophila lebanonensis]
MSAGNSSRDSNKNNSKKKVLLPVGGGNCEYADSGDHVDGLGRYNSTESLSNENESPDDEILTVRMRHPPHNGAQGHKNVTENGQQNRPESRSHLFEPIPMSVGRDNGRPGSPKARSLRANNCTRPPAVMQPRMGAGDAATADFVMRPGGKTAVFRPTLNAIHYNAEEQHYQLELLEQHLGRQFEDQWAQEMEQQWDRQMYEMETSSDPLLQPQSLQSVAPTQQPERCYHVKSASPASCKQTQKSLSSRLRSKERPKPPNTAPATTTQSTLEGLVSSSMSPAARLAESKMAPTRTLQARKKPVVAVVRPTTSSVHRGRTITASSTGVAARKPLNRTQGVATGSPQISSYKRCSLTKEEQPQTKARQTILTNPSNRKQSLRSEQSQDNQEQKPPSILTAPVSVHINIMTDNKSTKVKVSSSRLRPNLKGVKAKVDSHLCSSYLNEDRKEKPQGKITQKTIRKPVELKTKPRTSTCAKAVAIHPIDAARKDLELMMRRIEQSTDLPPPARRHKSAAPMRLLPSSDHTRSRQRHSSATPRTVNLDPALTTALGMNLRTHSATSTPRAIRTSKKLTPAQQPLSGNQRKSARKQLSHPPPAPAVTPTLSARISKQLQETLTDPYEHMPIYDVRTRQIITLAEAHEGNEVREGRGRRRKTCRGTIAMEQQQLAKPRPAMEKLMEVPLAYNPETLAPAQRQALIDLLTRAEQRDRSIIDILTSSANPSTDTMRMMLQTLPMALSPGESPYSEQFWAGHRYLKERQQLHQKLEPDDMRYKEVKILHGQNGKIFLSKTLEDELKDEQMVLEFMEDELQHQREQLLKQKLEQLKQHPTPPKPGPNQGLVEQAMRERAEMEIQKQQVREWREQRRHDDLEQRTLECQENALLQEQEVDEQQGSEIQEQKQRAAQKQEERKTREQEERKNREVEEWKAQKQEKRELEEREAHELEKCKVRELEKHDHFTRTNTGRERSVAHSFRKDENSKITTEIKYRIQTKHAINHFNKDNVVQNHDEQGVESKTEDDDEELTPRADPICKDLSQHPEKRQNQPNDYHRLDYYPVGDTAVANTFKVQLEKVQQSRDKFQTQCQQSLFYNNANCPMPWQLFSNVASNLSDELVEDVDCEFNRSIANYVQHFLERESRM